MKDIEKLLQRPEYVNLSDVAKDCIRKMNPDFTYDVPLGRWISVNLPIEAVKELYVV